MEYVTVGSKIYRCGYTTGTSAAVASAAAAAALLGGKRLKEAEVTLPGGEQVQLEVESITSDKRSATAEVIKDGGDDVDITDGVSIFSRVERKDTPGIEILGGEGVGVVTKPGLSVAVGEPAINPVPREMIREAIRKEAKRFGYDLKKRGIRATISIPKGIVLADKTFNPKLGIKGGLSILGTSGIVRPMSVEAIIETQKLELSQLRARGFKRAVLVFGNYGYDYALSLGIKKEMIVKVSNYIGEILDEAARLGFNEILTIGDLGKLVKVAGGIFRTHSSESDARVEILAANLALLGAPKALIEEVFDSTTTVEAAKIISRYGFDEVYPLLVEKIVSRLKRRSPKIHFETVLFSKALDRLLAETNGAKEMIEMMRGEKK